MEASIKSVFRWRPVILTAVFFLVIGSRTALHSDDRDEGRSDHGGGGGVGLSVDLGSIINALSGDDKKKKKAPPHAPPPATANDTDCPERYRALLALLEKLSPVVKQLADAINDRNAALDAVQSAMAEMSAANVVLIDAMMQAQLHKGDASAAAAVADAQKAVAAAKADYDRALKQLEDAQNVVAYYADKYNQAQDQYDDALKAYNKHCRDYKPGPPFPPTPTGGKMAPLPPMPPTGPSSPGGTSTPGSDSGKPGGSTPPPDSSNGQPGGNSTPGGNSSKPGDTHTPPGGNNGKPGGDSTSGGNHNTPGDNGGKTTDEGKGKTGGKSGDDDGKSGGDGGKTTDGGGKTTNGGGKTTGGGTPPGPLHWPGTNTAPNPPPMTLDTDNDDCAKLYKKILYDMEKLKGLLDQILQLEFKIDKEYVECHDLEALLSGHDLMRFKDGKIEAIPGIHPEDHDWLRVADLTRQLYKIYDQLDADEAELDDLDDEADALLAALLKEMAQYNSHCKDYLPLPPLPGNIDLIPLGPGPAHAGHPLDDDCKELLAKTIAAQVKAEIAREKFYRALAQSTAAKARLDQLVADEQFHTLGQPTAPSKAVQEAQQAYDQAHAAMLQASKIFRDLDDAFHELKSQYEKHCGPYPETEIGGSNPYPGGSTTEGGKPDGSKPDGNTPGGNTPGSQDKPGDGTGHNGTHDNDKPQESQQSHDDQSHKPGQDGNQDHTADKPKDQTPPEKPAPPPVPPYPPGPPSTTDGGNPVPPHAPPPEGGGAHTPPPEGGAHAHTQEREQPPRLGILLERSPYWIPEDKGFTLLHARIYAKSGEGKKWVPSDIPTTIAFHFVERSHEPGNCLNHGDGTDPDLWFPAAENPKFKCTTREEGGANGDFPDYAETRNPATSAVVEVSCGDYGAFSKIEAEGDGCVHLKEVDGELVEISRQQAIQALPKDDNDNQIADMWETIVGKHPKTDDDKDNIPEGNGLDGDGFSAYEEYRGFMVKGTHRRTDWEQKDLFVCNPDNVQVNIFESATNLTVWFIDATEMHKDRVVNFNRNHASLHEQHALLLRHTSLSSGVAGMCQPRLGPPKYVDYVSVDPAHCDNKEGSVTDHELGHGVSMKHHGNRSWGLFGTWGSFYNVTTIYPDTISNRLYPFCTVGPGFTLCGYNLPNDFIIETEKHAQQSGNDHCIMRYPYGPGTVFHNGDEWDCVGHDPDIETIFCTSPQGTGLNANGHAGGDATNGNCMGQIVINDLAD